MLRAASTGRLDYKEADSNSIAWLLRERMVINELERDAMVQLTARKQLQQAATAVWPEHDAKGEMFKAHYERANAHLQTMGKLMFPYLHWDEKSQYRSEIAQMRAEYVVKFGDPSSPMAREQAKKDLEAIKRNKLLAEQRQKLEVELQSKRERDIQRLRSKRTTMRK